VCWKVTTKQHNINIWGDYISKINRSQHHSLSQIPIYFNYLCIKSHFFVLNIKIHSMNTYNLIVNVILGWFLCSGPALYFLVSACCIKPSFWSVAGLCLPIVHCSCHLEFSHIGKRYISQVAYCFIYLIKVNIYPWNNYVYLKNPWI